MDKPVRTRLTQRVLAFETSRQLRKELGWSYEKIAKRLRVPISTVHNWVCGINYPYGSYTRADLGPSPCLSYFAGAFLGDGGITKSKAFHYELRLRVKDREFAQNVSDCLSRVIHKARHPKSTDKGFFVVRVWSRLLFEYFSDWKSARETAEYFPADFVRGFADAEGSAAVSVYKSSSSTSDKFGFYIVLVNTNKQLLEYIARLMKTEFQIRSNILLEKKRFQMWGKLPCYHLTINRREDQRRFAKRIGFGIKRKNQKMLDALHLLHVYGPQRSVPEWRRMYEKRGRNWVRRTTLTFGDGDGIGAPGGI